MEGKVSMRNACYGKEVMGRSGLVSSGSYNGGEAEDFVDNGNAFGFLTVIQAGEA